MPNNRQPSAERLKKWSRVVPHSQPIFQTSVYDYPDLETFDDFYNGRIPSGYIYSRNGLPNSTMLGNEVAVLENTESGLVCSSGMGAISVALLSAIGAGDHIVASNDLYGGTTVLLKQELSRFGMDTTFVDATRTEKIEDAMRRKTKVVFIESISNPTMKVCDIEKVGRIAHKFGSKLVVDNTFATPFVVRPSELGADIVMHSGTKFLGGHGDVTIGVLCGAKETMKRLSQFCTRAGIIAGPFDCWLAARSLATWRLRVKNSCSNAMQLAKYLESRRDKVSRVYYPGLSSHPMHDRAKKIFDRGMFGGMVSFDLNGGLRSASAFVRSLSTITLTPSLGGASTTVSHPGKTSHRYASPMEKKESGISDSMIRVSVGIEDYDLIEQEFKNALEKS